MNLDLSTFTTVEIPITADNLPIGHFHEDDGSIWRAIVDSTEVEGWRWQPLNWTALGKGEPDSEMIDHRLPMPAAALDSPAEG